MTDIFDSFARGLGNFAKIGQSSSRLIERKELECIELYKDGWRQDGFERIPNSYDIIVFWKKDGVNERHQVRLNLIQQHRWIRLVEEKIKSGEIKI